MGPDYRDISGFSVGLGGNLKMGGGQGEKKRIREMFNGKNQVIRGIRREEIDICFQIYLVLLIFFLNFLGF